jgi:hypothetical protein
MASPPGPGLTTASPPSTSVLSAASCSAGMKSGVVGMTNPLLPRALQQELASAGEVKPKGKQAAGAGMQLVGRAGPRHDA